MVKRLPLLLFIGLAWGQGIVDEFEGTYGIVGWQISELKSPLTLDYIQKGFDSEYDYSNYPDTLESVSFNGGKPGLIIGFGYQWINYKTEYWDIGNPIMMLYTKLSGNSFDYTTYNHSNLFLQNEVNESNTIGNIDWCIGGGYGIKLKNGVSLSTNIEYTFTGVKDWNFMLPAKNYLSLNFKIGASTRSSLGHIGMSFTHHPNKYFINKSGPLLTSNEAVLEFPGLIAYSLLAIAAVAGGADASSVIPNSSSSNSNTKGCHVYGNIKFVQFGEDYKIKFVNYGENLKIKYVSYGADSPGAWKVVKYGEDFKVKIVKYGEDFKVKEVTYGQGCN